MTNEIEIQKGQEANKLLLMRELMQGFEDLFELVKNEDADSMQRFFGADEQLKCEKCGAYFIPHLMKPLTICDKCADSFAL